jgi:hypothetical protein
MSGSAYTGYFLSIFVRAPELWAHHAMGKAALVTFVDADGLWRNLISLDGRELYRLGVSGKKYYDAPEQVDAEKFSARRSVRTCRMRFYQCGGGLRAMSWPTAISMAASFSSAMRLTSIIRRPGSD